MSSRHAPDALVRRRSAHAGGGPATSQRWPSGSVNAPSYPDRLLYRLAARVRRDGDHPAGDQRAARRARPREDYVGEWLPEPIITDGNDDPARHAEISDSLSLALLVLLEALSPEQRAVLLLHDVFDYGYPEIAGSSARSEVSVRQLASRARKHVEQRRPRFQTTATSDRWSSPRGELWPSWLDGRATTT